MPAGATYEPIATTTLGSATTTVTFSSISGSYTDLFIVVDIPTATVNNNLQIRYNSDTGSNYSFTQLQDASSNRASNATSLQTGALYSSARTTNIYQIQNYSNTTTYKTQLCRFGNPDFTVGTNVGLWRNTNAITSIEFKVAGGTDNYPSGTTFTLYGIKAA